jgi:hypothetical protein
MNMLLSVNVPDAVKDCCPDWVYAIVFDDLGNALKSNGSGGYVLAPYVATDHADFCIVLGEDTERSKFYKTILDEADFTLESTPVDSRYSIEYWIRETGDTAYNRAQDRYLETKDFWWLHNQMSYSPVPSEQIKEIRGYTAHVAVSYDAELQTAYITAWLDLGNNIVTDTVRAEIDWRYQDGTLISNTQQTTHVPDMAGVFAWNHPGLDLTPDTATAVLVTIEDADGNTHQTVSAIVNWD